jgi:hypothetical protein
VCVQTRTLSSPISTQDTLALQKQLTEGLHIDDDFKFDHVADAVTHVKEELELTQAYVLGHLLFAYADH